MNQKEEIIQWISKLQEYAKNQGLSMRILDSIEDCRQHIYREDMPWQELRQQIEGVMESVGLKVQQTDVASRKRNDNSVSVEKVQAQVRQMAEECHRENMDSVAAVEDRKNINIRESIRQMGEITHTEAHMEQLLDKNRYTDYFQQIKNSYEQNMSKMAGEMVGDISGNYDHMANHMKSMFQSIGGYADGIGNEKFYREYETEKDKVRKKLTSETQTADYGGSSIMEFASRTMESIHDMTKKFIVQKRLLIWIPIILLVVIVISMTVVKYQTRDDSDVSVVKIMESMPKNAEEVSKLAAFMYFMIALIVAYIGNIVAAVLIFTVLYAVYRRVIKKWCSHRICEKSGEYLRTELAAFERENQLAHKTDQAVSQIVEDCEQQYLVILNRIFAGTKYEEKAGEETTGFEVLQRQWDKLKYR